MHKEHVYIGIGSNLGDPVQHVEDAFIALGLLEGTRVLACSSLYSSTVSYTHLTLPTSDLV